jgi:putative ATP-dependent endonuclease of OLD family
MEEQHIRRRVVDTRGEILFAHLVVLFEGETEELALPLFFDKHFGCAPHDSGICFVGIGGVGSYGPFLKTLESFRVPWLILSDGEERPLRHVRTALRQIGAGDDDERLVAIPDGKDFEGHLFSHGYESQIEEAINAVDGLGAVDRWMARADGQKAKRKKTDGVDPIFRTPKRASMLWESESWQSKRRTTSTPRSSSVTLFA